MLKDPECLARYEESISALDELPKAPTLDQIHQLQAMVAEQPQTLNDAVHRFADGMYIRELTINAGDVVVGKMHRHEHPAMLIKGSATVYTDTGVSRMTAPYVWISTPGVKRVVYAHDECVFVTVHLNQDNAQDMDAIEAFHIVPEHLELDYQKELI